MVWRMYRPSIPKHAKDAGWVFRFVALVLLAGCDPDGGLLLPPRASEPLDTAGLTLVARIVHLSDAHIVDEESPARFAGGQVFTRSAWRPYESYSAQLLDGIIRTANREHAAERTVDFVVTTGDLVDNAQTNELAWFIAIMDGQWIDPLSGPDDRAPADRPDPLLDPHEPFQAQGLYREGVHGESPSIPWYVVYGNHDAFALGLFPIVETSNGHRTAPLPLDSRPGYVLPRVLDPLAPFAYGNVTPAEPGPPALLVSPRAVAVNAERVFFKKREFVRTMFATETGPPGHGFSDPETSPTWYSVSPAPGLRLIALDTTDAGPEVPGITYLDGAISAGQWAFLQDELERAAEAGELVVIASHHPSQELTVLSSAVTGPQLRDLLGAYPNVILHLCGHLHRNRVIDRGTYFEIETCSTLDLPQEGRIIEIWRDDLDGSIVIRYEMFSHLDDDLPPLGDDPLRTLRERARSIALNDKRAAERQLRRDPSGVDPAGSLQDRSGVYLIPSPVDPVVPDLQTE